MAAPTPPNSKRAQDPEPRRPMLWSKLTAPVPTRYSVSRSRIADRVFQSDGPKVVLVRAPAGFGKTTAMLQMRERYGREGIASGWLNLDDADNDPPRFLGYFALALREILALTAVETERALRPDRSVGETALILMERIVRHPEPFVIFMDELEALRNPAVLALIVYGIEHFPDGGRVVIGSRGAPDINLPQLRARGELLEIDPSLLRFSAEESGEFLMKRRGLALNLEQVQRLHQSTEGWAAALWLASLSLERRSDADEFIAGFAGSNAVMTDYLADDVLAGQAEPLREFMIKTSILDQLTPQLCNAICARDDSAVLLDQIERANLFLIPLDEQRSSYRYHSLFAEFLRAQLARLPPKSVFALHRAATEAYLQQNRPIPAIKHAFNSGDPAYAIALLDRHADELLGSGRLRLLTHWLDGLPQQSLDAYPRLRLTHAWAVTFTRGPQEALQLIDGFQAEAQSDPEAIAQHLALRPMLLGMMDRIDEAHQLGIAQLPRVQLASSFAYGMLAQCLANTHVILGHSVEAHRYADEARKAQLGHESSFYFSVADSVEGTIDLMQGRLRQATTKLRSAAGLGDHDPVNASRRNAFSGVLLAEVLYEAGDSSAAEQLLRIFVPLVQNLGLADQLISSHGLLARILFDRGEVEASLKLLADLEAAGHRLALARVVASARVERARCLVMQGDFQAGADQLRQSGDAAFWKEISGRGFIANDLTTLAIGQCRLMNRRGALSGVVASLKQQLEEAEQQQRHRRALKLRILLAEALYKDEQRKPAMQMLSRALSFAAGQGFVRIFLEEGPAIRELLAEYFKTREDDAANPLLLQLLQDQRPTEPGTGAGSQAGPVEQLSPKEIEVLELLGQGHSNDVIAEKLFVSLNTVRTHLRKINMKLRATSRYHALAIARRVKLIP